MNYIIKIYVNLFIVKTSRLLLVSSIMSYVLYDTISTLAAYNFLGTFEYEKSMVIKASYDAAGIPGFLLVKILFSTLAIFLAYMLMERQKKFLGAGTGMLAGATIAGMFVGTSNFNIVLNGSSIWILGLDSGTIAALIIVTCTIAGHVIIRAGRRDSTDVK